MNTVPGQGGGTNLFSGLSAQQLAALSGVLGGQSAFSQAQLTALTNPGLSSQLSSALASVSQQQAAVPIQNPAPLAVENKSSISGAANSASGAAPDLSLTSLPWPVVSPIINVPHFDLNTYRLVNLDVAPSRDLNGFDLPLADVTTLRFFFNLGVQHSRSLAATQLYQEKLAHVGVSAASPSIAQPTQASLGNVPQLTAVNLLPTESTSATMRTMEQYINQLGIGGAQAHALLRQAQTHHLAQQAQLLAAAARLPDRPHPSYGSSILPLHTDLLQLAAQTPISVAPAVAGGQLIRPPLFSNPSSHVAASPSASNSTVNPHKQIPPSSAAAEQQAFYLQQALSAVATAQGDKSEVSVHALQQQNSVGLHPYVRPTGGEVVKPVAIGGISQDAAFSPRPPDPSPPHSDASVLDSNSSTLVHQQAQTSPPVSTDQNGQDSVRKNSLSVYTARPQSARERGSSSTPAGPLATPQNSAPATPALTADDVVPVSQTLFQVSEQHFTEAFNASRKKSEFSSIANPIGIAKNDSATVTEDTGTKVPVETTTVTAPVQGLDRKEVDDKPALAPILMMTYLSNCMSNIKSTLSTNGLPVGLDANGRAVDYSSRPIDPIFQQARARMENAREFRELSPPTTLSTVSRSSFEEGFSPIGVALPTVSATVSRPQVVNPVGVNRVVPDTALLEQNGEEDASEPPAEKRSKVDDEGE